METITAAELSLTNFMAVIDFVQNYVILHIVIVYKKQGGGYVY